jgi:hypothetical protein
MQLECNAADVSGRFQPTAQGYLRFHCRACGNQFDERIRTRRPGRSSLTLPRKRLKRRHAAFGTSKECPSFPPRWLKAPRLAPALVTTILTVPACGAYQYIDSMEPTRPIATFAAEEGRNMLELVRNYD